MDSYLTARQDKGISRHAAIMKGVAALVVSSAVVVMVQDTGRHSFESASFSSGAFTSATESGQLNRTAFIDRLKASHPSSFKLDARGKAQVTIGAQTFYSCTAGGEQQVVTSKSRSKEKIVFQLNARNIAYNMEEGLGMWTIQWSEQLFLPLL